MRASALTMAASSVSWVVMTTGTGSSGARPRWSMASTEIAWSRSAAAMSAMTPGSFKPCAAIRQAAFSTETTRRLPSAAKAASKRSGLVAWAGSSRRVTSEGWAPMRRANSAGFTPLCLSAR